MKSVVKFANLSLRDVKQINLQYELISAIKTGDIIELLTLISLRTNLNFSIQRTAAFNQKNILITPLMLAIDHNQKEIFDFLCQIPVNLEALSSDKQTALIFAANIHNKEAIWFLINAGSKIDALDNMNNTALHILLRGAIRSIDEFGCIESSLSYLESAEYLINNQADMFIRNNDYRNADDYLWQLQFKLQAQDVEPAVISRIGRLLAGPEFIELDSFYENINSEILPPQSMDVVEQELPKKWLSTFDHTGEMRASNWVTRVNSGINPVVRSV